MNDLFFKKIVLTVLAVCCWLHYPTARAESSLSQTEVTVTVKDGTELSLYHYPAQGEYLLLWVASSYSMSDQLFTVLKRLANNGVEVWLIDFSEVLFQPRSSNFMRNINAEYVADIIEAAHQRTGKKIVAMARAYGAIPVLRGVTVWQQRNPARQYVAGVVLFSPDLYAYIPELGLQPEYIPVVRATGIPIMIFQGGSRGTRWQLPRLLQELQKNNPAVYFRIMDKVSGVFYQDDNAPETQIMRQRLPDELPGIFRLLDRTAKGTPLASYRLPGAKSAAQMNTRLGPFQGNPIPGPIELYDINNKKIRLENYRGKVTVVNFWATWCPPCVHEIPSLNNLRNKMEGKNFQLLSINYAESPQTVRAFMKQVNVEFPVLMDINGDVSAQWNVIAFPSTFIIGADGKIHYGVNAAIEWDSPGVINIINSLM